MIIGLSGWARAGKDTVADILVRNFGFRRIAFADKLKEVLYEINPSITQQYTKGVVELKQFPGTWQLQSMVDRSGWDEIKKLPDVRRMLQVLGETMQNVAGNDVWINAALVDVKSTDNVVVSDCRYKNEADRIEDRGGRIWRIERPGIGPANDHISEHDLNDWPFDCVINNNGGLEQLEYLVGVKVAVCNAGLETQLAFDF